MIAHRSRRHRRPRLFPSVLGLELRQLMSVDVLTYHNDNARDGVNTAETTLTPANVNSTDFGKVGFLAVDGKVDAQPLVDTGVVIPGQGTHDVVYVATENDSVYAFDATSGALLWHDGPAGLLAPGETPASAVDIGCTQVEPTIGITSTPVIDPTTNTMYVVAMSEATINGTKVYYQRIHALDITTGADKVAPHSIDESISVPGAGPGGNGTSVFFDPEKYEERDALTLSNGVIYTGWASHCDSAPYTGWIIGFNASNLSLAAVANVDPNGTPAADNGVGTSGGSFWNSSGGFATDAAGNLYNISGNGPFDTANGDYGDSYVRLATTGGTLTIADYFAPSNQQYLSDNDVDLGSSGVVVLPDMTNAAGVVEHLLIGSGKDGNVYLLNRDDLGGFSTTANNIVQELTGNPLGGAEFGTPTYYDGTVYFGGVGSTLKAFSLTDGVLSTTPTSQSPDSYVYPGATVSVSSNGTADGIVWAALNGDVAALHAYDASNLGDELYASDQVAGDRDDFGAGNKFITPTIADGQVYVGTTDGVAVFGLLNPTVTTPVTPVTPVTPTPPVTVTTPVTVSPPTVAVPALSTPTFLVGGLNQLAVLGADTAVGEANLTYTWSVLSTPSGAPTPVFTLNGTNTSKLVGVGIAAPGAYSFRVTITSTDGQSVTSDVAVTASVPVPSFAIAPFAGSAQRLGTPILLGTVATDPAFSESSLTYTWATVSLPKQAHTPHFTANNSSTAALTAVTNLNKTGTYVFQVRVTNPFGQTATAEVSVVVGKATKVKAQALAALGTTHHVTRVKAQAVKHR